MDTIAKKIMAANPAVPAADIKAAMQYIAACRPDGWCDDLPDTIVWQGKTYGLDRDDRPGLRDYASAAGVAADGSRVFIRLHYVQTDDMTSGLCVAWSIDEE